jgi:hypothetical protein
VKTIAWLAGIGTLIAAAGYMLVSLNRWEWNRALFFGLVVIIAEVGLGIGLVLRKLGQMSGLAPRAEVDPELLAALRDTRPPAERRFGWLDDAARGQLNVFITFLVGGGVVLSALAWLLDRVAAMTSTPVSERRLARRLGAISYPKDGLLVDERPLVQLLRRPS